MTPSEADEAAIEATKAPLLEHLVELRKRIVISLIAFVACFILCFAFARDIYAFLTAPLAHALAGQPNHHLIYTALYETFFTYVSHFRSSPRRSGCSSRPDSTAMSAARSFHSLRQRRFCSSWARHLCIT
jgi:hypothetical protein